MTFHEILKYFDLVNSKELFFMILLRVVDILPILYSPISINGKQRPEILYFSHICDFFLNHFSVFLIYRFIFLVNSVHLFFQVSVNFI